MHSRSIGIQNENERDMQCCRAVNFFKSSIVIFDTFRCSQWSALFIAIISLSLLLLRMLIVIMRGPDRIRPRIFFFFFAPRNTRLSHAVYVSNIVKMLRGYDEMTFKRQERR